MRASLILGMVLSFALSGSAMAETIFKGVSRNDMRDILAELGMNPQDKSSDEGPLIVATNKALIFNVLLYECGPKPVEASQKCGQIQFRAIYNNNKGLGTAAANRFQTQKVFGRAYISDDASLVIFEYPMNLEGGVTKKNLIANINYFLRAEADFEAIVAP